MHESSPSATSKRPALSEANIRTAKPGDTLRDDSVPGLHLRAFAGRKSFYLWFRTKAGVERKPKLGDHGVITLTQARDTAKTMLAQVALGGDPVAVIENKRNEPVLEDLWDEYWKRHGSKKKSGGEDLRRWTNLVKPRFAHHKLSSITYSTMSDFHDSMTKNNGPVEANRTMALLSRMYSFAFRPLQWFEGPSPCAGVRRNKELKRKRKASREEVARIILRLRAELDGHHVASAAFILLLVMTGARSGEIAATKWSNINGNRILLDEHKTDDGGYTRIIYLSPPAMELIQNFLPVTNGTITGILSPKKFWARICKEENLPDLRLHDLRRTFASIALSTGQVTLEQVMQLLGHTNAQTTKVYAYLLEDSATALVGLVAGSIEPKLLVN
jgi:integrase